MICDNSDGEDGNVDDEDDIEGVGLDNDEDDVEVMGSLMAHLNPKNRLHEPHSQTFTSIDLGIHTGEACYYLAIRGKM